MKVRQLKIKLEVIEKVNISSNTITSIEVDRVLEEFKGVIEQIPPMYSSVKVNGKNYMNMLEKEKLLNGQNDKLKLMKLNEYLI